jgi:hypothetical protein
MMGLLYMLMAKVLLASNALKVSLKNFKLKTLETVLNHFGGHMKTQNFSE